MRLQKDSLLLGSLVAKGWGNSWGVYLTCDRDLQEAPPPPPPLSQVQLPDGKQVYFRYYDPRVLRIFLPTCNADETNQFFGPIKQYLMEDGKPDKLLQFANTGRGTDKKVIDLSPPGKPEERPPSGRKPELCHGPTRPSPIRSSKQSHVDDPPRTS